LRLLERRLPLQSWESITFGSLVPRNSTLDPETLLTRLRSKPQFFFSREGRARFQPFFKQWDKEDFSPIPAAERIAAGCFTFFSRHQLKVGLPPDWHKNPQTGECAPVDIHWSRLNEFAYGDVKWIWELSRFSFVYTLVRAYCRTGDEQWPDLFWRLVEDWAAKNPPQHAANWKCGQEIVFRIMAWCFGLFGFLDAQATTPARAATLLRLLAVSAKRIEAHIGYALSQQNNHGISEAAGLWTVGILFPELQDALRWRERGQKELERLARELIYDDGGFSQHAINYHRVMLEDYLWCIQLGKLSGQPLSSELRRRIQKAGEFVAHLMDPDSGRVPNWGANDGAHVLPLTNCEYLDYRPVVQTAAMIAGDGRLLPAGPWDEQALWLGLDLFDSHPR